MDEMVTKWKQNGNDQNWNGNGMETAWKWHENGMKMEME
jgi:hypothetical protein